MRGKILALGEQYVILDVENLGFRVFVRPDIRKNLRLGERAEFFVHEHLREDAREFYGFKNLDELNFFWTLISISGVGPKLAQNVLSLGSVREIKQAIADGAVSFFTRLPGIGAKIAQKIILELKGKISLTGGSDSPHQEAVDALTNLGYRENEARAAVQSVQKEGQNTETLVRAALKVLGK